MSGKVLHIERLPSFEGMIRGFAEQAGCQYENVHDAEGLARAYTEDPPDLLVVAYGYAADTFGSEDELIEFIRQQEGWQEVPVLIIDGTCEAARVTNLESGDPFACIDMIRALARTSSHVA